MPLFWKKSDTGNKDETDCDLEISKLLAKCDELNTDKEQLQGVNHDLNKHIVKLNQEIQDFRTSQQDCNRRIHSLIKEKETHIDKIESLRKNNSSLECELHQAQRALNAFQEGSTKM